MDNEVTMNLRVPFPGRGRKITLQVDGRACAAHQGETVHAALTAGGIRILRVAGKTGESRGVFCGMGICYECRVTIDGIPDQRACMTLALDGMQIETR